jgi:hypothetical protein
MVQEKDPRCSRSRAARILQDRFRDSTGNSGGHVLTPVDGYRIRGRSNQYHVCQMLMGRVTTPQRRSS